MILRCLLLYEDLFTRSHYDEPSYDKDVPNFSFTVKIELINGSIYCDINGGAEI